MPKDRKDEPTPLLRPLPKATEVPLADLGPLIGPIKAITTLTQAPDALALQGVLTAISIAAQALANVETLFGEAPLSLFAFSVAESSARKSSVDRLAMKAIREYEKPLLARYAQQLVRYEERLSRGGGLQVIDDEREEFGEDPITQPINPKISFDDMTYEGLVKHLEFGQPSIGLSSDEGAKIVGGYAMSPQNALAFAAAFSNLWDGRDINKVRAGSGSINLAGRRLALHLSIQPLVAQRLFTNDELRDQGLLSRVLVAMPDSLKGTRLLREDDETRRARQEAEEALHAFGERIKGLLRKKPEVSKYDQQELTPRVLKLETDARKLLVEFYNIVESQQAEGCLYERIAGFAGKAVEQAARIAGNIALFEDIDAEVVGPSHVEVAVTLMEYYLSEAVRIFDTGQVSRDFLEAEDLRVWLFHRYDGEFVDVSEVTKRGPRKLRSAERVKVLLRILEEYGHLQKVEGTVSINGRKSRKAFSLVRG